MPLNKPLAFITGGGTGIGRAVAHLLAETHALALIGRRLEPLDAVAGEVSDRTQCWTRRADVADAAGAVEALRAAAAHFGRLDSVVNNAGYAPMMTIDTMTIEEIGRIFAVNAIGPGAIASEAMRIFRRQHTWKRADRSAPDGAPGAPDGACIVNVSSYATVDPFPGLGMYAAAKASLNLLAKACANEGRVYGVRAFSVAPGAVETEMLRSIIPAEALPTSRTLSPEAVAKVIVTCIRGEYDSQNGQTILLPSP
jgi:NAD(P)-dependent dehydrogenase (short-subunit alcohol dehydrogenase family)